MERREPGHWARSWSRSTRSAGRVGMTKQYIIGELSLWLGQLQATAPDEELGDWVCPAATGNGGSAL